jgi:redox-sensitive bicupin YhaK (pirin superfamily)
MTAGKGLQHSEMFPLLHPDKKNTLEIFQIWLNLPAKSKMVDPHFKMLWKEEIPVLEIADPQGNKTIIDVIAGKINDTHAPEPTPDSWAANPANAVGVFTVKLEPKAEWTLPATNPDATRTLFYYRGAGLQIDDQAITVNNRIQAKAGEPVTLKNQSEPSYLLILEGKPINEPVVQHGPFVMNTQAEIREAMLEYGKTQFGGWPWNEQEVVHGKKGRFALHGDGREEVKS